MSTPQERYPWPTTMPSTPQQRPTRHVAHASPTSNAARTTDPDETSAGNAGFENAQDPATPQERAEYQRGWRLGMGTGLVGGCLIGALCVLSVLWLGFRAGLAAL